MYPVCTKRLPSTRLQPPSGAAEGAHYTVRTAIHALLWYQNDIVHLQSQRRDESSFFRLQGLPLPTD
jgi:hypothetical protein